MKRAASSDVDTDTLAQRQSSPQPAPSLYSLRAPVSPPQRKRKAQFQAVEASGKPSPNYEHNLAAIEAGEIEVEDHLGIFSTKLHQFMRPTLTSQSMPHLPIAEWVDLYQRNEHPEGRHFVIHQHDHPVAGPHYDLRLQISKTSSVSWSIMYGLPGDPNSQRLNRNATETRIHCLWNHLIETASVKTGSMIIWDTGEYEVLPYYADKSLPETDDSRSEESDDAKSSQDFASDSTKLHEAFKNRKIRLRLHGTRLPKDYTIMLRMDKTTDYARPIRNGPKRRRKPVNSIRTAPRAPSTSDSDIEPSSASAQESAAEPPEPENAEATHSDNDIDFQIQLNNAYPGSTNTIGSIHQRRWYLSLDRASSGFEPSNQSNAIGTPLSASKKRLWIRSLDKVNTMRGFDSFYVRGPEVERSIVTGRLGKDVLDDEKVEGFVPRRGWRPVLN
ncbi:uncharacterized protein N7484_011563 [Penicillium longicatenatum]|uniref:uncharacterized protein n=1 Tax=Penicillium longicatenatum TaxID=1561947 RepID=UPI002548A16D|nr:uncharacterized protein N7484_011563 [Penicillium longicatenatum]KAJ5631463.1 hypothetical protein N7484_011563 [Penicillium longicatenatum]